MAGPRIMLTVNRGGGCWAESRKSSCELLLLCLYCVAVLCCCGCGIEPSWGVLAARPRMMLTVNQVTDCIDACWRICCWLRGWCCRDGD